MATVAMSPGPVSGAGWEQDGFVLLPQVVRASECAEVLERARRGTSVVGNPMVADLVATVAGIVAVVGGASDPAPMPPGAGAVPQGASSDVVITLPGAHGSSWTRASSETPAVSAIALLALSHATLATGCPWVVPGSHRDAVGAPTAAPVDGGIPLPLVPGDVLVLDGDLVHRRTDNHSIDTTAVLIVAFPRPGG